MIQMYNLDLESKMTVMNMYTIYTITEDILCIMENPREFLLEEFGQRFKLRDTSIASHTQYLSNKVSHITLDTGISYWSISTSRYLQAYCIEFSKTLSKERGETFS